MTALADATDPRFTDVQRAALERFERAETPGEAYAATVERVARAICESDEDGAWDSWPDHVQVVYRRYARAALAAMPTDAEAERRGEQRVARAMEALAERYEEIGCDTLAADIRAALAAATTEAES